MSTKDFSRIQENKIANYLGWSVVRGSGAAPCSPGDIISDDYLGECKTHVSAGKKIYFNADVWKKICNESVYRHRFPVLFTDDGSQDIQKTWCITFINCLESRCDCMFPQGKVATKHINMPIDKLVDIYRNISSPGKIALPGFDWNGSSCTILPIRLFKELID